jgi:hypothetical protein
MRLAAGDSLLKWGAEDSSHQGDMLSLMDTGEAYAYYTEDANALAEYLRPGQYTVAVGNPPYITVKDKYLNGKYRELYKKTCSGKYALSVPFVQRFFQLVRMNDEAGRAGIAGQITANSFMKREFGKKLIEDYFAHEVELTHVIDTSGAYIPGHGTPTVILVGRRRPPRSKNVFAILGVLGEPSAPEQPVRGLVWSAIVASIADRETTSPYITAIDVPRPSFTRYPWSLTGGGASALMELIEHAKWTRLGEVAFQFGFTAVLGEDDAYLLHRAAGLAAEQTRPLVVGDDVRDYSHRASATIFWPYGSDLLVVDFDGRSTSVKFLWPNRTVLRRRLWYRTPMEELAGVRWFEYAFMASEKLKTPLSLAYAFVATHNHFVLDRGGKVFNRSAPVIKLPAGASEDDHLRLFGLLNSSTACFWLKQVSHNKGEGGGARVDAGYAAMGNEDWKNHFEFTGTKLKEFPLPNNVPVVRGRRLDRLARELGDLRPAMVCVNRIPTRKMLDASYSGHERIRGEMIAVQEELDWEVYCLYGLLDDDLTASAAVVPGLKLGERAFEIVLARKMAAGEVTTEWFARHGSTPITEIPEHWPEVYKEVVRRRIEIIESRPDIALIERPECKRRWQSVPLEVQEKAALGDWLLDRLEAEGTWRGAGAGRPLSVAVLADQVGADEDFRSVLDLYCGRDDYDVTAELTKLVADEVVPFLAAYRYKPSGLDKRQQWERTWDLQRAEDAGTKLDKPIPVPPKYGQGDFAKTSYWRNRGKLDVPKERFIAYPHVNKNPHPVIGWAGWDHLEQAQALATVYIERKQQDGWPTERLLPLLAGLVELEPWLHQWHGEPATGYPGSPAEFYTTFVDAELAAHGADRADVALGRLP